jgi:hypothetical protein
VPAGDFFTELSPYARVSTAVAPFVIAIVLRLLFGKNRMTGTLITLATTWFVVNVLIAPYSVEMQQDIRHVLHR